MRKFWIIATIAMLLSFSMYAYSADEWDKSQFVATDSPSDIDTNLQVVLESIDRLTQDYQRNVELRYLSSSTLTVTAGQIVCSNSAESVRKFRNTADITVTWAMIDAGAEAVSTKYYVWVCADADSVEYTVKISLSGTTPTGSTYYKLIGSFYNNAAGNIDSVKVHSDYLNYDTDELEWGFNSGWSTSTAGTTYTKPHSFTMTIPTDTLHIHMFWRSGSGDARISPLTFGTDGGVGCRVEYDEDNIYYVSSGNVHGVNITDGNMGTGEVLILADKVAINF